MRVKRRQFEAELTPVLYGSGSWSNGDLRPVTKLCTRGINSYWESDCTRAMSSSIPFECVQRYGYQQTAEVS